MENYLTKVKDWLYTQFSTKPLEKKREDSDPETLNLVARLELVNNLEKTNNPKNN